MAGFAFVLALDANEIQVEKHIELCFSLSRYREYHLTTISKQFIFTYGWFCINFVLGLDANEIQDEKHILYYRTLL